MRSSRRGRLPRSVDRKLSAGVGLLFLATVLAPCQAQGQSGHACTEVLGFSQSMQWYAGMSMADRPEQGDAWDVEPDVFLPGWQGRFTFGAAIERWTDTDFAGWEGTYVTPSHCARGEVDRVVFNVSGHLRSADEWAAAIDSVAEMVRDRYHGVRTVVMQPVIGAPPGECEDVRAARNHPTIVEGIARAAERGVVDAGPRPTVSSCRQFRDRLGHLTARGAEHLRAVLRAHYGDTPR